MEAARLSSIGIALINLKSLEHLQLRWKLVAVICVKEVSTMFISLMDGFILDTPSDVSLLTVQHGYVQWVWTRFHIEHAAWIKNVRSKFVRKSRMRPDRGQEFQE